MGLHDNQNCINPCMYPDCKGTYAHPSPHLIEATAIDARVKREVALGIQSRDGYLERAYRLLEQVYRNMYLPEEWKKGVNQWYDDWMNLSK